MDAIACAEQDDEVALSTNGDTTVALLAGVVTVILANAAGTHAANAEVSKQRDFMQDGPLPNSGCVYGLQDPAC